MTSPVVVTIEVGERRLRVRFDDGLPNVLETPDGVDPPPTPNASGERVEVRLAASSGASFSIRAETCSP